MIPEYRINLNKKEREGPAMQRVSMEAGAGNLGKPNPRFQAASAHRTQERPSTGDAGKEERNLGKPQLPPRVSAGQPPHDNIRRPLINSTTVTMGAVLVILCMEAAAFLVLAVRRIFTVGRREIDR